MKENSAVYNSELNPTGVRVGNKIIPATMSKDFKRFTPPPMEFPDKKTKKRKIMYFEEFSKSTH